MQIPHIKYELYIIPGVFSFFPKFTGFFGVRIVVDMRWLVSWSAEGSQGQRKKERKKERVVL